MNDKLNVYPTYQETGIFINQEDWSMAYRFLIYSRDANTGKRLVMPPTDWEFVDENPTVEIPPTFTLPIQEAQKFMDALWRIGFRPTDKIVGKGELEAVQKHLQDARELYKRLLDEVLKYEKG